MKKVIGAYASLADLTIVLSVNEGDIFKAKRAISEGWGLWNSAEEDDPLYYAGYNEPVIDKLEEAEIEYEDLTDDYFFERMPEDEIFWLDV